MGAQNAVVRRLAVPDLTTTVLTLTTAGLLEPGAAAARRVDPVDDDRGVVGGLLLRHGLSRLRCGPIVRADRTPTITSTAVATERLGRTFTDRLAALPASFPGTYLTDVPSTPIPEGCSAFPGGAGRSPTVRGRCPYAIHLTHIGAV